MPNGMAGFFRAGYRDAAEADRMASQARRLLGTSDQDGDDPGADGGAIRRFNITTSSARVSLPSGRKVPSPYPWTMPARAARRIHSRAQCPSKSVNDGPDPGGTETSRAMTAASSARVTGLSGRKVPSG